MNLLPWVLVAVLTGVVAWLLLALAGAGRTIASLRAAPAEAGTVRLSPGLPAGSLAPPLGSAQQEVRGSRHLVVFVDPDCAACDELVPAVIGAAGERRTPPAVLVGRGDPATHPASWGAGSPRVHLVVEQGDELSDAYRVDVTPTVFVVDEGGAIVAAGPAAGIDDVLALLDEVDGVRVAPGTRAEPEATDGAA